MVDELDLQPETKIQLKKTLKKFPILFGGGLGLLDIEPVKIELQPGAKPYKGKYYSTPNNFLTRKSKNALVFREKLSHVPCRLSTGLYMNLSGFSSQ